MEFFFLSLSLRTDRSLTYEAEVLFYILLLRPKCTVTSVLIQCLCVWGRVLEGLVREFSRFVMIIIQLEG